MNCMNDLKKKCYGLYLLINMFIHTSKFHELFDFFVDNPLKFLPVKLFKQYMEV